MKLLHSQDKLNGYLVESNWNLFLLHEILVKKRKENYFMMINTEWKLISNDFDAKIFKGIGDVDEYLVQDAVETGLVCSFEIKESRVKVKETSWAIYIDIDFENKVITLTSSDEKKNDN